VPVMAVELYVIEAPKDPAPETDKGVTLTLATPVESVSAVLAPKVTKVESAVKVIT